MNNRSEERSRYRIADSHRQQSYVALLRRDPETFSWTCKGHIDFTNGDNFTFSSQRTFETRAEAEDYMRRFACARIDQRLDV